FTYKFLKNKYKGPGDDYTLKKCVKTLSEYKKLFSKAPENVIKGEASVDMLYYHEEVVPELKSCIGDPKIIIMLREPSARAFSAYKHMVRDGREDKSFEEGLLLERERMSNGYEFIWSYKQESMYYSGVEHYLNNFSHVKVIIFEDFISNQEKTVNDTLSFLGVNNSEPIKIKEAIINKSGKPKSKLIHNFFATDNIIKTFFKKILKENSKAKIKNYIFSKNLKNISSDNVLLDNLRMDFKNENAKLEKLLNI